MKNTLKILLMAFVAITLVACSSDDEKKNTRLLTFHIANDRGISPGLTRKVDNAV